MAKKNYLVEQIAELEKLLGLKDKRIAALEQLLNDRVTRLEAAVAAKPEFVPQLPPAVSPMIPLQPFPGTITIPSVWPIQCTHDYPSPWNGTMPPACKKCGQAAGQYYTVTCQNGVTSMSISREVNGGWTHETVVATDMPKVLTGLPNTIPLQYIKSESTPESALIQTQYVGNATIEQIEQFTGMRFSA